MIIDLRFWRTVWKNWQNTETLGKLSVLRHKWRERSPNGNLNVAITTRGISKSMCRHLTWRLVVVMDPITDHTISRLISIQEVHIKIQAHIKKAPTTYRCPNPLQGIILCIRIKRVKKLDSRKLSQLLLKFKKDRNQLRCLIMLGELWSKNRSPTWVDNR